MYFKQPRRYLFENNNADQNVIELNLNNSQYNVFNDVKKLAQHVQYV